MADSSSSDVIPLLPEPGASAAHPGSLTSSSLSQPAVITAKELSKFKYRAGRFPDNKKYIVALLRTVCGGGDPLFQISLVTEKNEYDNSTTNLMVYYNASDIAEREKKVGEFSARWDALTSPPFKKNDRGLIKAGSEKELNRSIETLLRRVSPEIILEIAGNPLNSSFHIDPNYGSDLREIAECLEEYLFDKRSKEGLVQFHWQRGFEGTSREFITVEITYALQDKSSKKIEAFVSEVCPEHQKIGAPFDDEVTPIRYTYSMNIDRLRNYLETHCRAALSPRKIHSQLPLDAAGHKNTPKIFRLSSFFLKKMGTHKDHRQEKNVSVKEGCLDYIGTAFHATFDPFNERSPYEEITAWDLFVGVSDIQKLAPGSAERKVAWFFYLLGGFVLSPTLNIVRFFTEFLMKAISNWLNCMTNELSVGLFAPCGTKGITIQNRLVWGFFYLLLKPLQIVAETVRLLLRTMLSPINSFKAALEGNYYVGKLPVGWLLAGLSIVLSLSFWTALYFAIGPILLHMGFSFLAMSQASALVNLGAGVVSVLTHLFGMVASPALMGTVAFGSIMGLITAGHGVRELLTHIASEVLKPKNSYELFDYSKLDDDKRPFEREESLPSIALGKSSSR